MRLSYSKLRTFNDCQAKYEFAYVRHMKVDRSMNYSVGAFTHEVMERLDRITDLDTVVNSIIETGRYSYDDAEAVKTIIQQWYTEDKKLDGAFAREYEFVLMINGDEIVGRIDRVDKISESTFVVTDYKTSWYDVDTSSISVLQFHIYAAAIMRIFNCERVICIVENMRNKNREEFTVERQDLEKIEKRLLAFKNGIFAAQRNNEYPANPGKQCMWCPFVTMCEGFKAWRNAAMMISDNIEISEMVDKLVELNEVTSINNKIRKTLEMIVISHAQTTQVGRVNGKTGYVIVYPNQKSYGIKTFKY